MRAQPSFVKRVLTRVGNALTTPMVLRFAFAILRHVCPVLVVGKRVIVTRHAHVIELLQRDRDFSIEEINGAAAAKDPVAAFLLDEGFAVTAMGLQLRVARRLQRPSAVALGAVADETEGDGLDERLDAD